MRSPTYHCGVDARDGGLPCFTGDHRLTWGDRGDLNPRPPGPQPGALTELSYDHHGNGQHRTVKAMTPNHHKMPGGSQCGTKHTEGRVRF